MVDTFRKKYKTIDQETINIIFTIKSIAETLENEFNLIDKIGDVDKRCLSLARTNLEQSIMWAVKSIT